MSVSSESSHSSIVQDEEIEKIMHKTPKTPTKIGFQTTPKKSESKRSLFQTNSPAKSDDLGLMTPLSPSSSSSNQSLDSPQFSPNGNFSTPPRTPINDNVLVRCSPRLAAKRIEVKSSLFPDLKLFTPKSRRTPRTPKTIISSVFTPESQNESPKSHTPSMRMATRRGLFDNCIVPETDSSPSLCSLSQEINENNENTPDNYLSDHPTILGIKPISSESFYGPTPKPQKARTQLFIDTLERKPAERNLVRSFSKESLSSNKSFVSGGTRRRPDIDGKCQRSRSRSNSDRRKSRSRNKGIQPGVWHNIKKPKQIKKIQKMDKPLISPKSRLTKMLPFNNQSEIKVKEKSLFQEYPRKRISHIKKRSRNDFDEDAGTAEHFVKKKKLFSSESKIHPAVNVIIDQENILPDPNKKFMKYGQTRKATFTLTDSMKLQIAGGVMRLQTPKKRRKLYSGKNDALEDFNDFDAGDGDIQNSIEGILSILDDDKESSEQNFDSGVRSTPQKTGLDKDVLKSGRSPLKVVSNLPTLIINDFDSDDEENWDFRQTPLSEKTAGNELTLEKTGNMISYMTNILVNKDQDLGNDSLNLYEENNSENLPQTPNKEKLYSLFYKQNWNKLSALDDTNTAKTSASKRNVFVPDDQYLLDAGQESVGIITCKKCGVMYQAGDFADEATHNNFHNHLPELRFTGWNAERVVGRYPDGRVIMIINADPKHWWQKVSKIVDIVDQELGFPEAAVQSLFYKTVYLYINEKSKQIGGCLIAEECKVAYRMFPPLEGVEIDSCSKDPSPCKIGISRIWTALSHRRKGVARRMVECLQKTFFFGDIVPLDLIAFSVPSPSGKLFAQKVTGRQDFLVYGFP